jgi:tetratricopeptide (TPR) repeat protein
MIYSFVANHFQYRASIGPITLFTAWAAAAATRWRVHELLRIYLALALLGALAVLTWMNASSYIDAETLWVDTLVHNPQCWMAHNNLGVIRNKHGDEALRAAANAADPAEAQRLLEIGQEHFYRAYDHYVRAIELYPHDADVWHNLGIMHVRQKKYQEAIASFSRAIRLKPGSMLSLENLGLAYYLDADYSKALDVFERCLELQPDRARVHKSLGMTLAKLGRTDQALRHLQEALRLDPENTEARDLLESLETKR